MKPILFNTAMVQAILEGRKTVTRRVIKPQPAEALRPMGEGSCWPGCFEAPGVGRIYPPASTGRRGRLSGESCMATRWSVWTIAAKMCIGTIITRFAHRAGKELPLNQISAQYAEKP